MPTLNQRRYRQVQNAAAATGGQTASAQTQYFWHGYGETDGIGIVKAADGSFHRGTISGNEIPGTGARVGFTPGTPLGQIQLQTVGTGTQSASSASTGGAGGGHLLIASPTAATYTLIRKNDRSRLITDIDHGFAVGSGTAAFNYGEGDTIPKDGTFTLTLSALSGDAANFSLSVRFS